LQYATTIGSTATKLVCLVLVAVLRIGRRMFVIYFIINESNFRDAPTMIKEIVVICRMGASL